MLLQADTKNGTAKFCKQLGVNRNAVYYLILDPDGREISRIFLGAKGGKKQIIGALKAHDGIYYRYPVVGLDVG